MQSLTLIRSSLLAVAAIALTGCAALSTAKQQPPVELVIQATPAPASVYVSDTDGDGVPDDSDRCPGTPAGVNVDSNGCALDSDGDGVLDHADSCPGTRSGATVDSKGCEVVLKFEGALFEYNSAKLTQDARLALDQAAYDLRRIPAKRIEVAGHTDSRGSKKYNVKLSQRRALSVTEYLVKQGIPSDRLVVLGYGESLPIASNDTAAGRAANRRVELVDLGGQLGN